MFIFTADYSTQSFHWKWGQDAPDDDMVKCKILSAHIVYICEKSGFNEHATFKYAQIDRQLEGEKGKIQIRQTTMPIQGTDGWILRCHTLPEME